MNPLSYNNPVIAFLTKAADMLILSFYFFLCCIPVVTVIPSAAALYATVTDVLFGTCRGERISPYFFARFAENARRGIVLSLICLVSAALIYLGINTGLQIWDAGVLGAAYMALGILAVITVVPAIIFIPPVLARFDAGTGVIIRLAFYFSSRRVIRSLWYLMLLALLVFAVSLFPLVLVIIPALYADLIRRGTEKTMNEYKEKYISDDSEAAEAAETGEEESMSELNEMLAGKENGDAADNS